MGSSPVLNAPVGLQYSNPFWNTSAKNKGVLGQFRHFGLKIPVIATSLERSENDDQIDHRHPYVYTNPENLVKIDEVQSKILVGNRTVNNQ